MGWEDPNHDVVQDLVKTKQSYFEDWKDVKKELGLVKKHDVVAIVSGGLDSTTLVYDLLMRGYTPHVLSFDYGQRHKKELKFAALAAKKFELKHDIVDLSGLTHLISNSALTSEKHDSWPDVSGDPKIEVPDGHYAEETMKLTVVPNRNMIMLSIAAGIAVNNNYQHVATGVHSGDHFIYPDCRPEFIIAANAAIVRGNAGFGLIYDWNAFPQNQPQEFVLAPFLFQSKADIALRALQLDVPLHETWSCYKGQDVHCGKCGTCCERLEAINIAEERHGQGKVDQTQYEDSEYWKEVVARGPQS
jgi:7-cyano-7-deazaguanine synthase